MKEVKAYLKKHKVDAVVFALSKITALTGLSVVEVKGFGRGRGKTAGAHMAAFEERLFDAPSIKLEVVCRDDLVEEIVSTIVAHAHTGLRSDGKIYVSHVENAVRISTGERGEDAV
jgi:nitrogen regulatory protein PII